MSLHCTVWHRNMTMRCVRTQVGGTTFGEMLDGAAKLIEEHRCAQSGPTPPAHPARTPSMRECDYRKYARFHRSLSCDWSPRTTEES